MFNQELITLDEATHTYRVKGAEHLRFGSVTEFVSSFFEKFDAEKIAQKIVNSGTSAEYKGQTKEEILRSWKKVASRGTSVHKEIEDWLYAWQNNQPEPQISFPKAQHGIYWLIENLQPHYKVYPEVRLYSIPLQLAGTVDLLIHEPKLDMWVMVDWKTNKQISTSAWGNKRGIHKATRLLPDCSLTKYSLQMSFYSWLLETNFKIKTHKRILIHLRPKQTPTFPLGVKEYETEYLKSNIEQMVESRLFAKQSGSLFSLPPRSSY